MGSILEEKFLLAGHSFGGFLSGHYACRYPDKIKKLLMLSPFGVPKRHFNEDDFEEIFDNVELPPGRRRPPKFAFKLSKKVWNNKWSPFAPLRKGGNCFVKMMLTRYVRRRIGGAIPENELMDYKEYMQLTLLRPGSTEYALFVCFDHFCYAKLPLDHEDYLKSLKVPISFFYGDRDWMTFVGTHDVLASNPYKDTHSHRYTLVDSDHHLYFDNPEGLLLQIFQDLANLDSLEITP
jgi:cardiolipin-specific phospholipase